MLKVLIHGFWQQNIPLQWKLLLFESCEQNNWIDSIITKNWEREPNHIIKLKTTLPYLICKYCKFQLIKNITERLGGIVQFKYGFFYVFNDSFLPRNIETILRTVFFSPFNVTREIYVVFESHFLLFVLKHRQSEMTIAQELALLAPWSVHIKSTGTRKHH